MPEHDDRMDARVGTRPKPRPDQRRADALALIGRKDGHRRQRRGAHDDPVGDVDRQVAEQDMADKDIVRSDRDQLGKDVAVVAELIDQRAFLVAPEGTEIDRADSRVVAGGRGPDRDLGGGYRALPSPAAASSTSPSALAISRISLLRMA